MASVGASITMRRDRFSFGIGRARARGGGPDVIDIWSDSPGRSRLTEAIPCAGHRSSVWPLDFTSRFCARCLLWARARGALCAGNRRLRGGLEHDDLKVLHSWDFSTTVTCAGRGRSTDRATRAVDGRGETGSWQRPSRPGYDAFEVFNGCSRGWGPGEIQIAKKFLSASDRCR